MKRHYGPSIAPCLVRDPAACFETDCKDDIPFFAFRDTGCKTVSPTSRTVPVRPVKVPAVKR